MLFDTHFHLDLAEDPKLTQLLIERLGIYTFAVTNLPGVFESTEALCKGTKFLRPALGFHPELVFRYRSQLSLFEELIGRTRYIGEVGLDNLRKDSDNFDIQRVVFERILTKCAESGNKILTIHSRKAELDVINMIGINFPGKVILHWFGGSMDNLVKALENGYFFSVNSAMTQSKFGINIVKSIPLERILLESDGPFIEHLGQRVNPSIVELVLSRISEIKGQSLTVVSDQLKKNFRNLLT